MFLKGFSVLLCALSFNVVYADTLHFNGEDGSVEPWQHYVGDEYSELTYFPSFGYADIPGTQITYPRFEKDPNDELYLTYRFASRPKRNLPERTFGTGLAEYSRADQTWTAIGEQLGVTAADFNYQPDAPVTSTPFATKTGWTAYHPSMVFRRSGGNEGVDVMSQWYRRSEHI